MTGQKRHDDDIPTRDGDGVADSASSAVEDIAEDFLGLNEDEDPSPDRPATSRG